MLRLSALTRVFVLLLSGNLACGTTFMVWGDDAVRPPNYDEHIKPLFRQACLTCHGDDKHEADLNLQSFAAVLRGGSGGVVVEAGRSSQSRLLQIISDPDDDVRMPPNSPALSKEQIALVQRWIDGGLRESATSQSMVKARDLSVALSDGVGARPSGPPAMPQNLPTIDSLPTHRPLPVYTMDSSPWAPLLAVSAQDHVKLLHSETEKELGRLAFPEGEPQVIRFSRNGALLMVAGGRPVESGKVVLFDVQSGKRLAEIGDEIDAVLAADITPDQQSVALGGSGRVVKVYSTRDGALRYSLTKHTDWITAVAFSPDGTRLATADRAGGIHLWDAASGGILLNLNEHKSSVKALDWRADNRFLLSASEDGSIIWWDIQDGFPAIRKPNAHPPIRTPGTYGAIPSGILAARFDRQGNLVTCGRDSRVRLWTPEGQESKVYNIDQAMPISTVFSYDGTKIIVGDFAGGLRFLDAK